MLASASCLSGSISPRTRPAAEAAKTSAPADDRARLCRARPPLERHELRSRGYERTRTHAR